MSSIIPVTSPEHSANHSLQAYIELIYIKAANEVMTDKMLDLENAMTTTQTVMDSLTRLQELKNLAVVKPKGSFSSTSAAISAILNTPLPIPPPDPTAFVSVYNSAASIFFGTPVSISASFASLSANSTGTFAMFQTSMNAIRSALALQISQLSAFTSTLANGQVDSNSLLAKLRIVYAETDGVASSTAAAQAWIIDSYNDTSSETVTNAGKLQQHITDAITAGQSLNSTQTEDLRSFMYLFEEYYKSASAILQAMTQIIQKMADGIAR